MVRGLTRSGVKSGVKAPTERLRPVRGILVTGRKYSAFSERATGIEPATFSLGS